MSLKDRIILGIDPGTLKTGYALIRSSAAQVSLLDFGVINLRYLDDPYEKLNQIFKQMSALILKHQPNDLAIESPFFGKNVQSMLKLGRAQGVAISAAIHHQLKVTEYAPREVKKSVAGNGNASKEQVSRMIEKQFKIDLCNVSLDATDALAVAICHAFNRKTKFKSNAKNGWKSFLQEFPEKVAKI